MWVWIAGIFTGACFAYWLFGKDNSEKKVKDQLDDVMEKSKRYIDQIDRIDNSGSRK